MEVPSTIPPFITRKQANPMNTSTKAQSLASKTGSEFILEMIKVYRNLVRSPRSLKDPRVLEEKVDFPLESIIRTPAKRAIKRVQMMFVCRILVAMRHD
jgi:hypothetical protein